jgi:hypothetical protein
LVWFPYNYTYNWVDYRDFTLSQGHYFKGQDFIAYWFFRHLDYCRIFFGVLAYSKYSIVGKTKRAELAEISLNQVMRDVEFYKLQYREYPDSLQQLKFVDNTVFIMDPLSQKGIFSTKLEYLHYKKIDSSHYTLFSAGLDQQPYTQDDLYPFIPTSERSGLMKEKR